MVAELLGTVAQLRTTIDKQQAHIQYLVRLTFGRRMERIEGPTLFDFSAPAEEAVPAPPPDIPSPQIDGKRRGHGRRVAQRGGAFKRGGVCEAARREPVGLRQTHPDCLGSTPARG